MNPPKMNLTLLKGRYTYCRLNPTEKVPNWAYADKTFCSISYTKDELSIACQETVVPSDIKQDNGWRVFKVAGPLDMGLIGILASLTAPLAKAEVSIMAVSTFETDYLMVKEVKVETALKALRSAGHTVVVE